VVVSLIDTQVDDGVINTSAATVPLKRFTEETDYNVIIVGIGCMGIGDTLILTRTNDVEVGDTVR